MINHYSKAGSGNVLSKEYQQAKVHLFAQILAERSEEIHNLNQVETIARIKANYGPAAWDILKGTMKGTDWQRFVVKNELKNFLDLGTYAKNSYNDRTVRRRMFEDLIFDYAFSLVAENSRHPGLEMLIYGTDAIAFLAKNKIQFIEDFSAIFSIAEASGLEMNGNDIGSRIGRDNRLKDAFWPSLGGTTGLKVREFSAALQEAAYCDLTSGSFKATIFGLKHRSFLGGNTINYGERAYWDLLFWLRPGVWLRQNLANTNVVF